MPWTGIGTVNMELDPKERSTMRWMALDEENKALEDLKLMQWSQQVMRCLCPCPCQYSFEELCFHVTFW